MKNKLFVISIIIFSLSFLLFGFSIKGTVKKESENFLARESETSLIPDGYYHINGSYASMIVNEIGLSKIENKYITVSFDYFYINVPLDSQILFKKSANVIEKNTVVAISDSEIKVDRKSRLVNISEKSDRIVMKFEDLENYYANISLSFASDYSLDDLIFYYYSSDERINLNIKKIAFNEERCAYDVTLDGFICDKYFMNGSNVTIYFSSDKKDGIFIEEDFVFFEDDSGKAYVKKIVVTDGYGKLYKKEYVTVIGEITQGRYQIEENINKMIITNYIG